MQSHSHSYSAARLLVIMLAILVLMPANRAQAANLFTVTNTNDSGPGSLRQAVLDANGRADPTAALIVFDIPPSDPGYGLSTPGVWTIRLQNPLNLSGGVTTIDGTMQKTNQGNTNPKGPNVEIDGTHVRPGAAFVISSGYNTIQGLAINGAGSGLQIIGTSTFSPVGNYIQNNYIGTDATGSVAKPNDTGVDLHNAAMSNYVQGNLIAGNTLDGVFIAGWGTNENRVLNNWFGKNSAGGPAIPNGRHGVFITNGPQQNVVDGNSIHSSGMNGVYIVGAHLTTISNNSIGECATTVGGECAEANKKNGIAVEGGSSATNLRYNELWWNKWHGIWISDSGTTVAVTGNDIGASGLHGVAMYNGSGPSHAYGNKIWYSGWTGVAIVNSNGNTVEHNDIGGYRIVADDPRGNGYYGVAVVNSSDNTIGPGNLIAHNGLETASDGVRIDGATALHNRITQNSIFANGGQGIKLVNGGNAPVIAPVLLQANCQGIVGGAIVGYVVEIFSDPSDEGRYYEGSTPPTSMTPFGWSGTFRGPKVTATATDPSGSTSEFSAPFTGQCRKSYLPLIRR